MGIYYAAVDNNEKTYFEPPKGFSNKSPGIFHPRNPFGCMVIMMNSFGSNFEIENDAGYDCYYDKDYKDVTDKVYEELLRVYPWAKEFYEKDTSHDS